MLKPMVMLAIMHAGQTMADASQGGDRDVLLTSAGGAAAVAPVGLGGEGADPRSEFRVMVDAPDLLVALGLVADEAARWIVIQL